MITEQLLSTIVGGVIALAAGALSASVALAVARRGARHQRERDDRRRLIEKYEAIHRILSSLGRVARTLEGSVARYLDDGVPQRMISASDCDALVDELMVLVNFYVPTLAPLALGILGTFSRLRWLAVDLVERGVHIKDARASLISRFSTELMRTEKTIDIAHSQLVQVGRSSGLIATAPHLPVAEAHR